MRDGCHVVSPQSVWSHYDAEKKRGSSPLSAARSFVRQQEKLAERAERQRRRQDDSSSSAHFDSNHQHYHHLSPYQAYPSSHTPFPSATAWAEEQQRRDSDRVSGAVDLHLQTMHCIRGYSDHWGVVPIPLHQHFHPPPSSSTHPTTASASSTGEAQHTHSSSGGGGGGRPRNFKDLDGTTTAVRGGTSSTEGGGVELVGMMGAAALMNNVSALAGSPLASLAATEASERRFRSLVTNWAAGNIILSFMFQYYFYYLLL